MRKSNFDRRHWKPMLNNLELPPVSPKAMRHTHASLLIKSGEHPKIIQERLGHSSIQVTMDVYGHLFEELQQSASDAMVAMFGNQMATKSPKNA